MRYKALLEHSFATECDGSERGEMSRLEFLSLNIFNFTTYDSDMDELFARKAIEVCEAITDKTTLDYIKSARNYEWYLVMCNMPFFVGRLDWGTSIRGAWWSVEGDRELIRSCGLWDGDRQLTELCVSFEDWPRFIRAIIGFAAPERGGETGQVDA
ncbi:MAG: hypothetical protein WBA83_16885 [Burkholderiaceae bacterium]